MEKSETMKRYEAETGKQSAIVKFMAGGQALEMKSYPKLGPYDYNTDYIAWLEAKANISDEAIKAFQEIIRTQCDEISALKEKVEFYKRLMSVVRVEIDTPECVEKQELQYMDEFDIDLDEFSENGFKTYVCEKASVYDRLMSDGLTMKELANILKHPVAIEDGDDQNTLYYFDSTPHIGQFSDGTQFWSCKRKWRLPRQLVNFNDNWEDSLAFPDGWEEKK